VNDELKVIKQLKSIALASAAVSRIDDCKHLIAVERHLVQLEADKSLEH
jgi:hypothetical protein